VHQRKSGGAEEASEGIVSPCFPFPPSLPSANFHFSIRQLQPHFERHICRCFLPSDRPPPVPAAIDLCPSLRAFPFPLFHRLSLPPPPLRSFATKLVLEVERAAWREPHETQGGARSIRRFVAEREGWESSYRRKGSRVDVGDRDVTLASAAAAMEEQGGRRKDCNRSSRFSFCSKFSASFLSLSREHQPRHRHTMVSKPESMA
jgi:hypothetical protein